MVVYDYKYTKSYEKNIYKNLNCNNVLSKSMIFLNKLLNDFRMKNKKLVTHAILFTVQNIVTQILINMKRINTLQRLLIYNKCIILLAFPINNVCTNINTTSYLNIMFFIWKLNITYLLWLLTSNHVPIHFALMILSIINPHNLEQF